MKAISQAVPTTGISKLVEDIVQTRAAERKPFERRWYDNNFFDDGWHFRYLSRSTGRIIDLSEKAQSISPIRAIPKASRQIRGIANLLLALEPQPSIYPQNISRNKFSQTDPLTGQQMFDDASYQAALAKSKDRAQRVGHWIEDEWRELEIKMKLMQMVLLTTKHGVSFMEIWPDANKEKICAQVFDAFDIYLSGSLDDIYKSPSITKALPTGIKEIKSNELFDEEQRMLINPDNKYASSEVKQAYMQARFGYGEKIEGQETLLLKETFFKEFITPDNIEQIKESDKKNGCLDGKNKNDQIMRHVFSTTNGWLKDEYIDLDEYPFVDYRMEPGLIYQVPLIERLIPANKSLDIAMSRIEGFANTMITGIYMSRKGENFRISNIPGGQKIEYETKAPEQMQPSSVPSFMFNYLGLLQQFIEEQGASTAALGQLPEGVRSGTAIESIKATEYSNLKMATDMLKNTVGRIAERMIEVASKNYYTPHTVMHLEKSEPDYFDVIGERGAEARQQAMLPISDETVVINKDMKVRIDIESGLGYTMEGKRDTMAQIVKYMIELAGQQLVGPDALKVIVEKFLETFQFGSTQEFMEALDKENPQLQLTEEDIEKVKIALAQVLKDLDMVGPQKDEQDIMKAKVAQVEAQKDLSSARKNNAAAASDLEGLGQAPGELPQ